MNNGKQILRSFLPVIIFLAIAAIVISATASVGQTSQEEAVVIAENSIRRAVMTCYSQECTYPPSIEYLEENYGLHVSSEFVVYYDIFASNIMPDITVLRKN